MMFDPVFRMLQPFASDALSTLLDAAIKSSFLLVAAAGITTAMRRGSAAQRHLVWSVAVLAALGMPVLARAVPRIEVPIPLPELVSPAATPSGREAPAEPSATFARGPAVAPAPSRPATSDPDPEATVARRERVYRALGIGEAERQAAEDMRADWLDARTRALDVRTGALETRVRRLEDRVASLEIPPSIDGSPAGASPPADQLRRAAAGGFILPAAPGGGSPPAREASRGLHVASALPGILTALWLAGALAVLATLLVGALRLRWIARRATPIRTGRLARTASRIATRLGVARVPLILAGDDASIPMTWGLGRPIVLLPPDAADWQTWRLEAVLLHELGHVQRRDYLSQMAAHLACALYWFNPLSWIAAHRMRVEREHACDDLVVASGREAAGYAHDLLALARSFRADGRVDAVALGMARPDHLRDRLVAVMDGTRSRNPLTRGLAWGAASVALALALTLASLSPSGAAVAAASAPDGEPTPREVPASEPSAGEATVAHEPAAPEATARETVPPAVRSPLRDLVAALGGVLPTAGPSPAPSFRTVQEVPALCGPADGESHSQSSLSNDGIRIIETEYGSCRSSVRIEGELEFSDDFTKLTRLSSDGFLRLEVSRDGSRRRLEARPGPGGRPEYAWSVDGRERPFDAEGERWLSAALLDLFRVSGYMATERATWILSREGPDGVLAEVERMQADHAQARYLSVLLERGSLTPAQVRRVIEVAGRQIESDHSLGEVLQATAASYSFDAPTRAAFLEAARSLESDHQQGEVFRTALARGDLSEENLSVILEAAATDIESDHQLAEILMELSQRYPLEPSLRAPFLRAAATLESDHQKGEVYGFVLQQPGLRPEEMAAVLEAAQGIDSDHTLSQLLVQVADRGLSDPALRRAFLQAARTIESDHDRSEVYRAALQLDLSDEELAGILSASSDIDSDHELSTLLMEVGGRMTTPGLQRAYLDAASNIGSDHNLSETLSVLVGMDGLGEGEQIRLLEVARQIDSDHNLSEILIQFAHSRPVRGAVRAAFLAALDDIESEHQHGQVASALIDNGGG